MEAQSRLVQAFLGGQLKAWRDATSRVALWIGLTRYGMAGVTRRDTSRTGVLRHETAGEDG